VVVRFPCSHTSAEPLAVFVDYGAQKYIDVFRHRCFVRCTAGDWHDPRGRGCVAAHMSTVPNRRAGVRQGIHHCGFSTAAPSHVNRRHATVRQAVDPQHTEASGIFCPVETTSASVAVVYHLTDRRLDHTSSHQSRSWSVGPSPSWWMRARSTGGLEQAGRAACSIRRSPTPRRRRVRCRSVVDRVSSAVDHISQSAIDRVLHFRVTGRMSKTFLLDCKTLGKFGSSTDDLVFAPAGALGRSLSFESFTSRSTQQENPVYIIIVCDSSDDIPSCRMLALVDTVRIMRLLSARFQTPCLPR